MRCQSCLHSLIKQFTELFYLIVRTFLIGSNPFGSRDSTRLRCPKNLFAPLGFSTAAQSCAFASSSTGCAQARTPSCRSRRSGSSEFLWQHKKHPDGCFLCWRRKRDLRMFHILSAWRPKAKAFSTRLRTTH